MCANYDVTIYYIGIYIVNERKKVKCISGVLFMSS